jgi:hypothetical protein
MSIPLIASRTRELAAKRRLAASSVAPVASGYARSLRPCDARFSRLASTISSEEDRS